MTVVAPGRSAQMAKTLEKGGVSGPAEELSSVTLEGRDVGVFTQLVQNDTDIAGLIAYSLYKQNKVDWLDAFEKEVGRIPNADEHLAYSLGETTTRRLAIYKQLAVAVLSKTETDMPIGLLEKQPSFKALIVVGLLLCISIFALLAYGGLSR